MRRLLAAALVAVSGAVVAVPAPAAVQGRTPNLRAMAAHFRRLGYIVVPAPQGKAKPYLSGIVIRSIDVDTGHAFHVAIYRFGSGADAKAHERALVASFGQFPKSNQSQVEGSDLFVGTTASTELHCTFSPSGKPSCKPYTFPHDRFEAAIAVAESS